MTVHQRKFRTANLTRHMTIQQALEWSFAAERAALDFDQYGAHEFDRVGVDPLWRGAKMAELGCSVDGGGSSDPHPDATIIVGQIEYLARWGYFSPRMAIQIADLARARRVPDWGKYDRPAVIADGWEVNDKGSLYRWKTRKREKREEHGKFCPVRYTGWADTINAKRRNYHEWWEALLLLAGEISRPGALTSVQVMDGMPDVSPWV